MLKARSLQKTLETINNVNKIGSKYNIFTSLRAIDELKERITTQYDNYNSNKVDDYKLNGYLAAIKDNISTIEESTTCSSKMLQNYKSPYNATVIDLLEKSGTTIIGKTNLDEFGMGSSTTNTIFGPTLNPMYSIDKDPKVSGGSSGGSAAAVAAGLVDFALGTDTGGSIRLPASYCGIFGFKPTYGRISRWGVISYAQSLDTVGILSKDVKIIKSVYKVLNDYDSKDPTSLNEESRLKINELINKTINNDNYNDNKNEKKYKIGIPLEFNILELSKDIKNQWLLFLKKLIKNGNLIYPISIPSIKNSLPIYYILAPSEASSNLARYDGIRYGFRDEENDSLNGTLYAPTRIKGFSKEVKQRIILGTYNLSSEAFKNHYLKSQLIRKKLQNEFNEVFKMENILTELKSNIKTKTFKQNEVKKEEKVDFIISPTAMTKALSLSKVLTKESSLNPAKEIYINDVLTVPASLTGLPTISIPWKNKEEDIPIGIQIMGQFGDDERVLDFTEYIYQ